MKRILKDGSILPHRIGRMIWGTGWGYKITKAYYDQAEDKKAAVKEIFGIKNFEKILEESGYGNQFN
jgi:hypothetical protein